MPIPADLPHPEVDTCFTGMRNTVQNRWLRLAWRSFEGE